MWASGNVAQFPSELMSPRGADALYKRKWMNWCRHSGVRETVIHHRQGGPSIINDNSLKFYQKLTIQHFLWMHFPFGDVCFKIGVILNIHQTLLIGKCNCWVEKCSVCRCLVVTFCGSYSFQACIIKVSRTCLLQKTNSRLPSKNAKLWCQSFYRLVYNCQIDSVIIKNLDYCWFSLELHTQLLLKINMHDHFWVPSPFGDYSVFLAVSWIIE